MPIIWNGTLFTGNPDMSSFGMEESHDWVGPIFTQGDSQAEVPDLATIDSRLASNGVSSTDTTRLFWTDDEYWDYVTDADKHVAAQKLIRQASNFPANALSSMYWGFPTRSYFDTIDYPSGTGWDAYMAALDAQVAAGYEGAVDAFMPSMYQFYRQYDAHEIYVRQMIRQGKERIPDKPMWPFTWHGFQPGGDFPPARLAGATQTNPCRITWTNGSSGAASASEPGNNMATGDIVHVGRWKENAPTYDPIVGMTELNGLTSIITKISDTQADLAEVDASAFTAYTSGGGIAVFVPLDQMLMQWGVCIEEADGFIWWGGFLDTLDETHGYFKALKSFVANIAHRVLILNGTTVIDRITVTARNVHKMIDALGGDGWCFAEDSITQDKGAGQTITGIPHGSRYFFYPHVTA